MYVCLQVCVYVCLHACVYVFARCFKILLNDSSKGPDRGDMSSGIMLGGFTVSLLLLCALMSCC